MTYEEKIKMEQAFNEKITNVILIFLLLERLLDYGLTTWIYGANVPDRVLYSKSLTASTV